MIAQDFPLEFAGFFPWKTQVKRGKYPVPPGKNPQRKIRQKIPDFFLSIQLRNGVLAYSSARFYVGTRTSPHLPCPALPPPPFLPCPCLHPGPADIPARHSLSAPAQRTCNCYLIFPSAPFFSFSHEGRRENFGTKGENSLTALKQPCQSHCAAPCRTEHCAQASCCSFCMYTMLHTSLQLSQISIETLTETPSCGSFCFFRITSSWCCSAAASMQQREYKRSAGATEWMQLLERGSMNAAHSECNCVNANIAIEQR